jgi:hypothetical protein
MMLHKIWLALFALPVLPFAVFGVGFAILGWPSRGNVIVLLPAIALVWAGTLFIRLCRHGRLGLSLRWELLAFYVVIGAQTVWVTTWKSSYYNPDSAPWFTAVAVVFFTVPSLHLLLSAVGGRQVTERTKIALTGARAPET